MMIEFITIHYCIPFIGVWAFLLVVYIKDQWSKKSESATNGSNDDVDNKTNDIANTKVNIDIRPDVQIQSSIIESSESKQQQQWKCACEGNGMLFLPQSLMKSLGGPGAVMRMGAGGCYHKQM
jgi:hypothetical protein